MMLRTRVPALICSFAVVSALAAPPAAMGQFIPKIPGPPEPTPEYTPPARQQPTAPAGGDGGAGGQPAGAEPEVPSLIDHDAQGKVIVHTRPPELVAIERTPFGEAQRAKIDAALERRREQVDTLVSKHAGVAIELRKQLRDPKSTPDLNTLIELRQSANPVLPQPPLLEFLVQQGAISSSLRQRIVNQVQTYDVARREGWQKDDPSDAMRIALEVSRDKLVELCFEPIESLDRLTRRVTDRLGVALQKAELTGSGREALQSAAAELGGLEQRAARLDRVREIIETQLDDAQREALFDSVREE